MKRITITIDEKTFEAFKEYCRTEGMKVSTKIQRMIEEKLREHILRKHIEEEEKRMML